MLLSFEEIRELLPQSYPFIFIDRVLELEPNQHILCLKNVTGGEAYFQGHFPNYAIMPGALILEALAQAAIILFRKSRPLESQAQVFLVGGVKARLLKPVLPGDSLLLEVVVTKAVSTGAIVEVCARVQDQVVLKGSLTFGVAAVAALRKQGEESR